VSYIYDVRAKLCSTKRLSEALRESPVDYKAPLTGSYTVLLSVGDIYATDDLGLIIIIIKIVLMVQHTYTHTMIKDIKRKYKAMTTEQITDKTYSVQIRRMILLLWQPNL